MSDQARVYDTHSDVGVRKPLSPGWHAELPEPFYQHDIYREHSDGTRLHMGTLTVEGVKAWQATGRVRRAVRPLRAAPANVAGLIERHGRACHDVGRSIRDADGREAATRERDEAAFALTEAYAALSTRAAGAGVSAEMRAGLEAAIDIVEAEFAGVNIFTDAYLRRMRAIKALRSRISAEDRTAAGREGE